MKIRTTWVGGGQYREKQGVVSSWGALKHVNAPGEGLLIWSINISLSFCSLP